MKRIFAMILVLAICFSFAACGADQAGGPGQSQSQYQNITIKESPDKYTWYVKNYVGKNCATLGYTAMSGSRFEKYGAGLLELIFVSADGTYVDISSNDTLKDWVVTGQSLEPNTEIKLVFDKDSEGKEYDNLVQRQNYDFIVLSVKRVGDAETKLANLTAIKPSPDKYTWYIADYVGRNLASCGYTSMAGDYRAKYGAGNIKFIIITDDGSYVDPSDDNALQSYVVTSQNVAPNTELKYTFDKDSQGVEYENLVDTQNIEEIELCVKKLPNTATAKPAETKKEDTEKEENKTPTTTNNQSDVSAGETGTEKNFTYTVLGKNAVEITKYTGTEDTVTIPSEIDGKDVTNIGKSAFENCTTVKKISIWAEIEVIDDSAFKGCTSLKEISIPYETETIGKSAFENCTSLEEVTLWTTETIGDGAFKNCTSLKEISIPYETETIGKSAFENCTSLEEVTLWATKTIGESAFKGCTSLKKVTIPYEAESIGSYAFYGCTSLEEAVIWNSDTELGTDAFGNCPNLKK